MQEVLTTGQTYKNFSVSKCLPLKELQATLVELVHKPTAARVLHIANDDPENLFCISFQTLPTSSNGVAHILEHIVLCGSDKFPVKDPFFAMTRRSLNTYMNALTGQDFTCYPAASQVEADFYNLLEVYLDATFHPQLKEVSFLQEGHRLEFADPKNPKGPLQFQGVVYNEMKGAMSSIESRLFEALMKHLTPDLPYAHNSGGNPKNIPSLSLTALREFHKKYYHPSRAIFFFYGNLPLEKHLEALEPTLAQSDALPPLPPLPAQERFKTPVKVVDYYPVTADEPIENKTQIVFSWLTARVENQAEVLAISLLENILADTDASFLTKALLKSGLTSQVDSMLDLEMSEVPWILVCKGCSQDKADQLEKVLFEALNQVKFSEEEIEAALHQLEFARTEIGAEGIPFGLSLFFRSVLIQQHGCEPEAGLLIHSLFDRLRTSLKDPEYLPNLLKKMLIENTHFVRLSLKPDPGLALKEAEEELARLKVIREKIGEKEEKEIQREMKLLKEAQDEIEHQSLECLPKVSLKDVSKKARDFSLSQKDNIYHHDCFTNQILYADLIFDLPELSKEELPLLSVLAEMVPELGLGGKNYEQTLQFQQSYIGSFDSYLSLHVQKENPNQCNPSFGLRGKVLEKSSDKLFELFMDTLRKIDFDDTDRVKEWLTQHVTELADRLPRAAMSYAIQSSLSGNWIPSAIYNQWHSLPYYQSVLKWAKAPISQFIEELKALSHKIFLPSRYDLVLGCDQKHFEQLEKTQFFGLEVPKGSSKVWNGKYQFEGTESHARVIAAPIAFTSLGKKSITSTDPLSCALLVASELMENIVLHKEIREKGGAYGSGATYTPSTGNFNFYSYRDPHLNRTVAAFKKAAEIIQKGRFNERELEEAKLGVLQSLDAPVSPGNRALIAYSWKRQGRDYQSREAFRKGVLSATSEQVCQSIEKGLIHAPETLVTFAGKELLDKESSSLPIQPI